MNRIKLVEGTHSRERLYQPQPPPPKKKIKKCGELVICLFCDTSNYTVDEGHVAERLGRLDGRSREAATATATATLNYKKRSDITKILSCYR